MARAPAGHPTGFTTGAEWQEMFSGRDARPAARRTRRQAMWFEQAELWNEEEEHTDASGLFAEQPVRESASLPSAKLDFERVLSREKTKETRSKPTTRTLLRPGAGRVTQPAEIARLMKLNGAFDGAGQWGNRFALPQRSFSPEYKLWRGSPVTNQPLIDG